MISQRRTIGWRLAALGVMSALLLGTPRVAVAQQCLGLIGTAQSRALLSQEASRSARGSVDRTRIMVALSRAMALTGSAVRTSYSDTEGQPWEARGQALMLSIEGPTRDAAPYRLCPTIEIGALRSNVANWGTPQEWKLLRFAPGFAAAWAFDLGPDFTLVPFAAGTLVIESFETVQPMAGRETRSYAIAELGVGLTLYKVFVLRLGVPVPIGRQEGYPGPYTMRTFTAGIARAR